MPTTTQQYWNEKNSQLNAKSTPIPKPSQWLQPPTLKPVWWTPPPTPKPSFSPTEERCRGLPCYERECRSQLGFCGTGIVYCNSASSWAPTCGGALEPIEPTNSPVGGPLTAVPSTVWEAWVQSKNDNPNDLSLDSDADGSDAPQYNNEDANSKDVTGGGSLVDGEEAGKGGEDAIPNYSAYDPDAWATNWDTRAKEEDVEEDLRWWIGRQSSSPQSKSLALAAVMWSLLLGLIYRR